MRWTNPQAPMIQDAGFTQTAGMSDQDMAVHMETLKAQQAMQNQQYQFWQQMRIQDAARGQADAKSEQAKKECRFVDDFRPMNLCKHMKERGYCARSDSCMYAHSFEELHVISPDLPKVEGDESQRGYLATKPDKEQAPDLKMQKKKELCTRFEQGTCLLGKVCSFAHGEKELGTVGLAVQGYVKLQLCENFEKGRCKFGDNCSRAHGEKQIGLKRPAPDVWLTAPSKRPKHLPVFKAQLKSLTPQQRREYDDHLKNLEAQRQNTRQMMINQNGMNLRGGD